MGRIIWLPFLSLEQTLIKILDTNLFYSFGERIISHAFPQEMEHLSRLEVSIPAL
jgi:hypothetical protein